MFLCKFYNMKSCFSRNKVTAERTYQINTQGSSKLKGLDAVELKKERCPWNTFNVDMDPEKGH